MEPDVIADLLDLVSEGHVARKRRKEVQTLRGIRGVTPGELARIADAAWAEQRPRLDRDGGALTRLFGQAWEDGMVAIGLLAASVPDDPDEALDLGLDWAGRVDDLHTADALGWLVLVPACLATGADPLSELGRLARAGEPMIRRTVVTGGLAMTPTPIEGPAAAPLRARVGTRQVRFVDEALSDRLAPVASTFWKDDAPPVRKALRRLLGCWAASDPDAAEAWLAAQRGDVPKLLRDELTRQAKKARRKADKAAAWAAPQRDDEV